MMNRIPVALIVAVDLNNGISREGQIPWKIKEDMNFFQDVTKRSYEGKKNAIIIGRNTWKAFPPTLRGLKDRINIVVSSTMNNSELKADNVTGCDVYLTRSLREAIDLANSLIVGKTFICGGNNIYKEALENGYCDELYLTRIFSSFWCDNKFPFTINDHHASILRNYRLDRSHDFEVLEQNSNKKVEIEFCKYVRSNTSMQITNPEEQQYLNLLEYILKKGHYRQTRNSNTWSVFGKTMEFDLEKGFPLLTTKKVFLRGVFEELLFFLKGDTNAKHLSEKGVKIWDANTSREFLDKSGLGHYEDGDMGPVYGYQWRFFNSYYKGANYDYTKTGIDQIEYCLNLLKTDPYSRRILMTTYNPLQAKQGVLYPCHSIVIQFYVEKGHRLSCTMYQRSGDWFLGVPFNDSSTSLLIYMFCEVINNDQNYTGPKFTPGRLIMNFGDIHIYEDHYSECIRQILREPYKFPQLTFKRKVTELTDFKYEDLELIDYQCYPGIAAKMVA